MKYLCSHNTLSLLNEPALGALAVPVGACLLVSPETGDEPMVAAPCALWHPRSPGVHLDVQGFLIQSMQKWISSTHTNFILNLI